MFDHMGRIFTVEWFGIEATFGITLQYRMFAFFLVGGRMFSFEGFGVKWGRDRQLHICLGGYIFVSGEGAAGGGLQDGMLSCFLRQTV